MDDLHAVQQALHGALHDVAIPASTCILFALPSAQEASLPNDGAIINNAFAQQLTHAYVLFIPGYVCIVLYVKNKTSAYHPLGLPPQWRCKNVKLGGKTFALMLARHAAPLSSAAARDPRVAASSPLRAPPSQRMPGAMQQPALHDADPFSAGGVQDKCDALERDLSSALARVNLLEAEAIASAARVAAAEAAATLLSRRIDELEADVRGLRPQLQAAMYSARQQQQQHSKQVNEPWPKSSARV